MTLLEKPEGARDIFIEFTKIAVVSILGLYVLLAIFSSTFFFLLKFNWFTKGLSISPESIQKIHNIAEHFWF